MTRWCRLWSDMPTDPKWRTVARRSGRPISEIIAVFVHMMVNASNGSRTQSNAIERGELSAWSDEDVAVAIDAETEHVAAIREAMQGKTLDQNKLSGWVSRQPEREDGSAERAKAWREKKAQEKAMANADERIQTQPNAPDKRRGDKIREEAARQASIVDYPSAHTREAQADSLPACLPPADLRDFEVMCRHCLVDIEAPGGDFGPMTRFSSDPDKVETILRSEAATRTKRVGSWRLWAQIVDERWAAKPKATAHANGSANGHAPPPLLDGPKVLTPSGTRSIAFLQAEHDAGRWSKLYGPKVGEPGCVLEADQ